RAPHPPPPPSFPTRRSSDLLIMHNRALTLRTSQDVLVISDLKLDLCQLIDDLLTLQSGQTAQLHGQDGISLNGVDVEQAHQAFTDRKSTRLNSSHVSISYAV